MPTLFSFLRRRRTGWIKRLPIVGLLLIQVGVAASPLLEPHHGSLVGHVEQDGATHRFVVHNEATCAVCAVRLLHASAPDQSPVPLMVVHAHFVATGHLVAAPSREQDPTNPSRAPPTNG